MAIRIATALQRLARCPKVGWPKPSCVASLTNMGKRTKKLIVYLDQNFLSGMSKANINQKVRPEFKGVYEMLHEGFIDEKLVIPGSLLRDIESSLATHLKEGSTRINITLGKSASTAPTK